MINYRNDFRFVLENLVATNAQQEQNSEKGHLIESNHIHIHDEMKIRCSKSKKLTRRRSIKYNIWKSIKSPHRKTAQIKLIITFMYSKYVYSKSQNLDRWSLTVALLARRFQLQEHRSFLCKSLCHYKMPSICIVAFKW